MTRLSQRDPATIVRRWGDPFVLHAQYARDALERDGRPGLRTFLRRMNRESRLEALIVDRRGDDLGGRPVPAGVDSLVDEVLDGAQRGFREVDGRPYFAYPLGSGPGVPPSVLVLIPPPRRHPIHWRLPDTGALLVVIALGGVLCYALARHLSAPLARLRSAVARLGSGDLSARVERVPPSGGDELASLGRDFNRMAERLESLVAAHRRLLRDVSHELRSPLARIRVAIALAEQDRAATPDPIIARIEKEAERLDALIGQILTLSRLEAGAGRPRVREAFDLAELARGVAEDAGFEATGKECRVRLSADGPVPVAGDRALLASAIENVVRNSVRVSPRGAEIEMEAFRERGEGPAVLRVLDRGPGVPEADLETMFEPFTRGEESRDRRSGGVGLGLAIARRAVESHDGTIRASLRPGGGLVVEIRIPSAGPPRTC